MGLAAPKEKSATSRFSLPSNRGQGSVISLSIVAGILFVFILAKGWPISASRGLLMRLLHALHASYISFSGPEQ